MQQEITKNNEFYQNCFNALKDDGILVSQGESPKFNEKVFVELNQTLKNIFGEKSKTEYSSREKFALNYYGKLMPFVYRDLFGIFGFFKFILSWLIGLFKPTYRQLRNSDMRIVAHKSAGLAAQTFMLSMASENYDTCPMEGLDSLRIKKKSFHKKMIKNIKKYQQFMNASN